MTTLFLLVCLTADPTQCKPMNAGTERMSVEECRAVAPAVAARIEENLPQYQVKAFSCQDEGVPA